MAAWPELSGVRLLHEVRDRGYAGGVTQLNGFLRVVRPPVVAPFELRFETPAGRQAQVDFAHFMVSSSPSRPACDRMKTAVLGEAADDTGIVYNTKLIGLGAHYGFKPRACKAYRAKTKGKIERPFRYVRANFFLARSFANLEELNRPLRVWLDTVANARLHGGTGRVVAEHFVAERASLKALPAGRSTPCCAPSGASVMRAWSRWAAVETTADCVRIHDGHRLVAVHALLHGRRPSARCCRGIGSRGARTQRPRSTSRCWCTRPVMAWHAAGWRATPRWPNGSAPRHVPPHLPRTERRDERPYRPIHHRAHPSASGRPEDAACAGSAAGDAVAHRAGRGQCAGGDRVAAGRGVHDAREPAHQDGAADGSNRGFGEWADIFGDSVVATALLDRLLHHAVVIPIEGNSYRLREHANLLPEQLRNRAALQNGNPSEIKRGPGRPRKEIAAPASG